jgi:hypothetical protein
MFCDESERRARTTMSQTTQGVSVPTTPVASVESTVTPAATVNAPVVIDKPHRLDPKIPKFSGLPNENIDKWLYQINSSFLFNNISEDKKLLCVISHLDGTALNLHRSMIETKRQVNQVCTWSEFERALSSMFRPVDYLENVRCQLRSLKHQQNMSYNDYVSKFLFLSSELQMNDSDLMTWFVDGLKDATKVKVRTTPGIDSFQKARDMATQFERSMNPSQVAQVNFTNSNQNKNQKKKGNKNDKNDKNSKSKDPNKEPKGKRDLSKIKCYACDQFGHYKSDCASPKSKNPKPKVNIVSPSKLSVCKLLTTSATIDGNVMRVGLDSGATTSVLSRSAAERFGIQVLPSQIQVESVLGASTKIDGVTKPIEVCVHGSSCTLTFLVIDHKQHDALLG